MSDRSLRYSERLAITEMGSLPPLEFEHPSDQLVRAVLHLLGEAEKVRWVGGQFERSLEGGLIEHFGIEAALETRLARTPIPDWLDIIEIASERATSSYRYSLSGRSNSATPMPHFASRFNDLADRHRFGYRLQDDEIQRIGSSALSETIVGPALLVSQRDGWDQVERSYREALHHQRGGRSENDDALTAAAAALESALKAAGLEGPTLGKLSKAFKDSPLAIPQLRQVPDLLKDLLERTAAVRNIYGDAHGRKPGSDADVPQELVDLTIHQVGAFIVYLERLSSRA